MSLLQCGACGAPIQLSMTECKYCGAAINFDTIEDQKHVIDEIKQFIQEKKYIDALTLCSEVLPRLKNNSTVWLLYLESIYNSMYTPEATTYAFAIYLVDSILSFIDSQSFFTQFVEEERALLLMQRMINEGVYVSWTVYQEAPLFNTSELNQTLTEVLYLTQATTKRDWRKTNNQNINHFYSKLMHQNDFILTDTNGFSMYDDDSTPNSINLHVDQMNLFALKRLQYKMACFLAGKYQAACLNMPMLDNVANLLRTNTSSPVIQTINELTFILDNNPAATSPTPRVAPILIFGGFTLLFFFLLAIIGQKVPFISAFFTACFMISLVGTMICSVFYKGKSDARKRIAINEITTLKQQYQKKNLSLRGLLHRFNIY